MPSTTTPNNQPQASKYSFLDCMDEGRLTEWLTIHGKNIVYGLLMLIAFIAIIFQVSNSVGGKPQQEYIQAASDFTFFTQATETQDAALTANAYSRLQNLMAKHPELHAAYDGVLAQTFLNRNLVAEAQPYATATFERTKSDALPFYADFAATSILISEQQVQGALEKAQMLQNKMIDALNAQASPSERSFGDELFAFNLLRIAMLQQQVGDKKGELLSWQQWKQYAKLEKGSTTSVSANVNPQAFRAVIQQLAVGAISIPDYIAYREKLLQNK